MSKLVHEFSFAVNDAQGRAHTALVRGAEDVGLWHGWIEFVPGDGSPRLRTEIETSQSNYDHLEYWASGLSPDYLEMAIRRARRSDEEPKPAAPAPRHARR